MNNDVQILRALAARVAELSRNPKQEEKRKLWEDHNSLIRTRPPVLALVGSWDAGGTEVLPQSSLKCMDPVFRDVEFKLRFSLFKEYIDDDEIIEPWVSVNPVFKNAGWGVAHRPISPEQAGGAYKFNPPIVDERDMAKLVMPYHAIDEEQSAVRYEKAENAIGDLIAVHRGRNNAYQAFYGDIAYLLGQFLGLEQLMVYMYDRPEWLHNMLAFLRDGLLQVQSETSNACDWTLADQYNQAMAYCRELPRPSANIRTSNTKQLWGFCAAQEYALISPAMHEEFLLQYQMPIMEQFGLIAYGCCEDLTRKIQMLRKIPNLRRVAVSPWADVEKCAVQLEDKYVLSWRPNPSLTICTDWSPDTVKKHVVQAMEQSRGCIVDITLKDVQTVHGEIWRFREWISIVKDASSTYA